MKDDFFKFATSAANGRYDESSSVTHFFLSKFKMIETPRKGACHYQEHVEMSVASIFNAVQMEANRGTSFNGSA